VIGYDENGLPKTKNVLAKTKKECAEKLDALKAECGWIRSKTVKSDMRFGDWVEFWFEHYCKPKLRPTTQANYESRIRHHIVPELGHIRLDKLTQADLQKSYNHLKTEGRVRQVEHYGEGLSNRAVRGCHATCRAALDKAVQEGLIQENPAIGCKLPPKKTREMQVLTREEMQRFLLQAKEENFFEVFLLELATGLRRGELLALQWDDLNFETGELRINKQVYRVKGDLTVSEPKTKASIRTIILPPVLLEVLREYKKGVFSRWMFPSRIKEDTPMDPAWCRKKMHTILELAQCKQIRFHDLRHPYVKHTTKIFSLRLMDFQAQAYPDARRKTRGACQLHRGGQRQSPVRPLCNRKRFSCLPPQSKISRILYAISIRLSGYTSTRSISSSASSVVSVSASKIALDASMRLSCRACSSCFCFACANTAA